MKFGWKVLIPTSLVWIMVGSTFHLLKLRNASRISIIGFGLGVFLLIMAALTINEYSTKRAKARLAAAPENDLPAPTFPVPSITRSEYING